MGGADGLLWRKVRGLGWRGGRRYRNSGYNPSDAAESLACISARIWFLPFTAGSTKIRGVKRRGGIERSWWTDVEPDGVQSELAWLREAVYGGMWGYLPPGEIPQRRVTAFERWRTDPSDLAHPAPFVAGALGPAAA